MTCALVAWFVATPGPQTLGQPPKPIAVATLPKTERCWAAVSGIATMALEVLFARLFSLIFHNSTYTFSFVLISFLLGISLGGLRRHSITYRHKCSSCEIAGNDRKLSSDLDYPYAVLWGTRKCSIGRQADLSLPIMPVAWLLSWRLHFQLRLHSV